MRLGRKATAAAIGLGVEFRPGGIYLAIVSREPTTVVGLAASRYPVGSGTAHDIRRPKLAVQALRAVVDRVYWEAQPIVAVAAQPVDPLTVVDPFTAVATIEAPVRSRSLSGISEAGAVQACAREVAAAAGVMRRAELPLDIVDCAPVAVIRFAERARPTEPMTFARGGTSGLRWTACYSNHTFEVVFAPAPARAVKLAFGGDLASLRPPGWGEIALSKRVRGSHPVPGPFTTAVGTALAAIGDTPQINFIGAEARRLHAVDEPSERVMERIGR